MGKTFGMNATRNRPGLASQPLRAVLVTLAILSAWTTAPHAFAQDNSPGSFTLPPGPQQDTSPPSNVQGPVDAESSPPRRTDQPAEQSARPPVTTIAPTPVPRQATQRPRPAPQPRATVPGATPGATRPRPAPQVVRPQPAAPIVVAPSVTTPEPATPPVATPEVTPDPSATTPLPAPELPAPELPDPSVSDPAPEPELDPAEVEDRGSLWWWAAAGAIALISLIVMALRQRRPKAETRAAVATAPAVPTATVPTPPLRAQRPAAAPPPPTPSPALSPSPAALAQAFQTQAQPRPQPAPVREFTPAAPPPPPPAPPRQPPVSTAELEAQSQAVASGILPDTALAAGPASTSAPVSTPKGKPVLHDFGEQDEPAQVPRLLLDFTTLGVDVTLVNAVARYHLGVTNMADIAVSNLALHGAIIQARRGMPPTVDPMRGDALLPHLQKIADIEPGSTQRCEGQIRLPLNQIEPIEMQGRMLFVPVIHIWIGYDGPDGTRYAVTQSFVLGEESSPPGPRVGPLRLDLGPRRFTSIGQRPLQPA